MRSVYRTIMPEFFRRLVWWTRNMFSYAVSERLPVVPTLDYNQYWQWRAKQGATAMTHPELVGLSAKWIPDHSHVLDIGCGSGDFLVSLQEIKPVYTMGIDVSEQVVALARARGIDARVMDATQRVIEPWGPVDVVTLFEVIEHLPNSEQLLLNLKTLKCPLIVSIPNTGFIYARLRLLMGRFPRQWIYHPAEHLRFWTLLDFRLMCEYLGFTIERMQPLKGLQPFNVYSPSLFAEYLVFLIKPRN